MVVPNTDTVPLITLLKKSKIWSFENIASNLSALRYSFTNRSSQSGMVEDFTSWVMYLPSSLPISTNDSITDGIKNQQAKNSAPKKSVMVSSAGNIRFFK